MPNKRQGLSRREMLRLGGAGLALSLSRIISVSAQGGTTQPAKTPPAPPPPKTPQGGGPWERDLMICTSEDGNRFSTATVFTAASGVPSMIKDTKGRVLAAFQWFPENKREHFDRVAVKISEDEGKSWSEPQPIKVNSLPEDHTRPFDPTLARLEDGRIRIYFSSQPDSAGQTILKNPATYSAISEDGITYEFEPEARFAVSSKLVIDPAVLQLGKTWHYTAPIGRPEDGAYHAVSDDGLNFKRVADIASVEGVNWTGNLVAYQDGMRFYGGSRKGIWWAFSKDGETWTDPNIIGVGGGDPAVLQVADKQFLLIFVGEPKPKK